MKQGPLIGKSEGRKGAGLGRTSAPGHPRTRFSAKYPHKHMVSSVSDILISFNARFADNAKNEDCSQVVSFFTAHFVEDGYICTFQLL